VKAIILVGGEATRLRPLTPDTPKAMMPVLNAPFLGYVIRRLKSHGADEIILTQSHYARAIKDHFGDGKSLGAKLKYVIESVQMGTAGAVKNSEAWLGKTFLVLNGDVFTDLDDAALVAFHQAKKAAATIALTPVADPSAYGLIETEADGRVRRFLEKPRPEEITTNMINAGTYVLEPEVLKRIPSGTKFSFERELFPDLLARGEPVYAYPSDAYWIDMGTPENYLKLSGDLLLGKSRQCPSAKTKVISGEGRRIHPEAEIKGPVLVDRNCTIARKAKITGPAVIGAGTTIGEGALVDNAVIWQKVSIGQGATVKNSIVANSCRLDDGCRLESAVLGDSVIVKRQAAPAPGSRIPPGTTVS